MVKFEVPVLFKNWNAKSWVLCVIAAGLVAVFWDQLGSRPSAAESSASREPEEVATYIPAGFVLVPIEIANFEALDSILGQKGVVDLFIPGANGTGRGRKVAERVRILRAPLNPNHFAVLAPESEAPKLVSADLPFFAVVQNPRTTGTAFEKNPTRPRRSRIQIESNGEEK